MCINLLFYFLFHWHCCSILRQSHCLYTSNSYIFIFLLLEKNSIRNWYIIRPKHKNLGSHYLSLSFILSFFYFKLFETNFILFYFSFSLSLFFKPTYTFPYTYIKPKGEKIKNTDLFCSFSLAWYWLLA